MIRSVVMSARAVVRRAGYRTGYRTACRTAYRTGLLSALVVAAFARPGLGADVQSVAAAGTLVDLWVEQQMEYRGLPGLALAVVEGDRVVWSKAYGVRDLDTGEPMTTATPFRVGSVSKLVTATAALALRDDGRLRLDDPITDYIPQFPATSASGGRAATVQDLLLHTSGLPREAPFPYWTDHVFPDRTQLLDALATVELRSAPGEEYRYSNFGMGLLGQVVATASGVSLAEFVSDRLFGPLGMSSSTVAPSAESVEALARGYFRRRPDGSRGVFEYYDMGALAGAGNVVSTVDDLARFASFHLGAGSADRSPAVPTRREMQRVHFLRPGWESGRGLGFSVTPLEAVSAVSHGGWIAGHRTHFLLVPEQNVAVVTFVNSDDGQPYTFARAVYDTFLPVLRGSLGEPGEAAPGADREENRITNWAGFFGRYADPWEWEYRVLELDGKLVLYDYSYPPADDPRDGVTHLERVSDRAFRMPDGGPVVFEVDGTGAVTRVRRRENFLFPVVGTQDGGASQ